jgi:chromosome segregation ATPase
MNMQAQLQLAKQTEESRLHQEHVRQLETRYTEQFKRQDRALKDIAAAMYQEEQAKIAAEKRLQTAKEQTARLEDEARSLTRKVEDANNRCQEAEIDRDEYQVCPYMPSVHIMEASCVRCISVAARIDSLFFVVICDCVGKEALLCSTS